MSILRTGRTVVTIVAVVAVPLVGAAWSAHHVTTTVLVASHRELVFTEVLLGGLTAALAAVFSWLTVAAAAGAATAVTQLTRYGLLGRPRRGSRRAAMLPRRRRGSAAAAAVTSLVLLAAGAQAASAAADVSAPTATNPTATNPTATATATATDPTATDPTVTDPTVTDPTVTDPTVAAGPAEPTRTRSAVADAAVVGGWTPQVSPIAPATASLVLGAPNAPTGREAPSGAPHVVLRGESLWSIAAAQLGPGASATEISVAWPRWWQANRDVIGDDPDLIHAGQQLRPPV